MDADDVGGGWILQTPGADACAVSTSPTTPVTPSTDETTIPWAYILGAAAIGIVVGYTIKGSKKYGK